MTNDPSAQVTQLLKNYCNGNHEALKELLPLIYNQLHKLAHQQRYFQRKGHTLNMDDARSPPTSGRLSVWLFEFFHLSESFN